MPSVDADRLKEWQARAWGYAPFEPLAAAAAQIHDDLVARLAPAPGERWLDVATGTGPVALRAAQAGSEVTGLDLAPEMVRAAAANAARAGQRIRFDVADAEAMPYVSASFDVVASAQGVMFALDPRAAARELARVCRPGGRLGLACLARAPVNEEFVSLWRRFLPRGDDSTPDPLDWGSPEYVERLLGDTFSLRLHHGDAPLEADSCEELWTLHRDSCGPIAMLARALPSERRADLRAGFEAFFARYRSNGRIRVPRPYVIVTGTRR